MKHHDINCALILYDSLQNKQLSKPYLNFKLHNSMDITDMLASVPQVTGMMYDTRILVNLSIYSIC